ncbi:hypothetical protein SAMN02910400_02709 [Lachnospiraceae bacterium C10]|nr:hypothetical protein SAMN02910400_02709 [Lachnospiraceae bacterium C10]
MKKKFLNKVLTGALVCTLAATMVAAPLSVSAKISFVASYLAFQYVVQKPTIFLHPTTIVLPVIIFTAGLLYKSNRYRFFVFLGVLVCLYSIYITGNYGIQIAGILLLLMGNDAILTGTAVAGWIWLMQSLRM